MKKLSAKILIIISILLAATTNSNANMFNKFKKGFYFEKYKTAEEAKSELLELYPIGSDVNELLKALKKAGAEYGIYREEMESYEYVSNDSGKKGVGKRRLVTKREIISDAALDYFSCEYRERYYLFPFCSIDWLVTINIDSKDNAKTSAVKVNRDFFCL